MQLLLYPNYNYVIYVTFDRIGEKNIESQSMIKKKVKF